MGEGNFDHKTRYRKGLEQWIRCRHSPGPPPAQSTAHRPFRRLPGREQRPRRCFCLERRRSRSASETGASAGRSETLSALVKMLRLLSTFAGGLLSSLCTSVVLSSPKSPRDAIKSSFGIKNIDHLALRPLHPLLGRHSNCSSSVLRA